MGAWVRVWRRNTWAGAFTIGDVPGRHSTTNISLRTSCLCTAYPTLLAGPKHEQADGFHLLPDNGHDGCRRAARGRGRYGRRRCRCDGSVASVGAKSTAAPLTACSQRCFCAQPNTKRPGSHLWRTMQRSATTTHTL